VLRGRLRHQENQKGDVNSLDEFVIAFLFGFVSCLCIVSVPLTYFALKEIAWRRSLKQIEKKITDIPAPEEPEILSEDDKKALEEAEKILARHDKGV
jgi:hypothetical protein